MNDEAQNKMYSVPTWPRHWVRSRHLSLINCRGARSRHGEENWPDKRGSGAANSLKQGAGLAGSTANMVECSGNPSRPWCCVVIDCLSSSNVRVYFGSSFASQRFGQSQGGSEVPNWEFLFRCGPSKPLRFKLSYQKTSSTGQWQCPHDRTVLGNRSAIHNAHWPNCSGS